MISRISLIAEELFPFVHCLVRSRRMKQQAKSEDILSGKDFAEYSKLSEQQILDRLEQERQRAATIDEKTFKLTFSLSVGLAFLGLAVTSLIKVVDCVTVRIIVTIFIGLGVLYVLGAGFVAVAAMRTLPSYGYGTRFLLCRQGAPQSFMAATLASQETMNLLRHIRNEAAYQALRNGLLFLFVGILVVLVFLIFRPLLPFSASSDVIQTAASERIDAVHITLIEMAEMLERLDQRNQEFDDINEKLERLLESVIELKDASRTHPPSQHDTQRR